MDQNLQVYSQITERAEKALEIFRKIRAAQEDAAAKEAAAVKAESAEKSAQEELGKLEEREKEAGIRAEKLAPAKELLIRWETDLAKLSELENEIHSAETLRKEAAIQKEKAGKAQREYEKASRAYEEKHARYEELRRIFLNMQAGFIAREQLRKGQPCPVCGSLEHPDPCRIQEEHSDLNRETLDRMEEEASALRQTQENAASASRAALTLLSEKESYCMSALKKLAQKLAEQDLVPGEAIEDSKASDSDPAEFLRMAGLRISERKAKLLEEGKQLKEDVRTLEKIQFFLQSAADEKQRLKQAYNTAAEAAAGARQALTAARASLASLEASRDYSSEEEAREAIREARAHKERAEQAYTAARGAEQKAKSEKENAETLTARYQQDLPYHREERERRRALYEQSLAEQKLGEEEWKALTEKYHREDAQLLRDKAELHNRRKAAAQTLYQTAEAAIDGRERPVLEALLQERNQAEEKLGSVQEMLEEIKGYYSANIEVCKSLTPVMEQRGKIMEDHRRLDDLYNLLAGKVSGARMDIETFVQRYYLERILYAANRRFHEMSAGQFELRMCDIDRAGTGKNRGLDLMVYSAVTGKEREVRTLSGGESFMAALSLALGMADQIQESAASVNLDMMFIDEGFGSLDDNSRDKAVRVLKDMANGSKLIGIISHITELKQEIEDQLLVRKDESGSHVRWQIS